MNRKFADLDPGDPQYAAVQDIKHIITDPRVDAVLHLHDGWGFYSPTTVSDWQCPQRWGQSVIIDQDTLDAKRFGNLDELAATAAAAANEHLYDPIHAYHVKNTHTRELENETAKEMSKTLTFFALGNQKPAFGIEGSKNLPPAMGIGNICAKTKHITPKNFSFVTGCFNAASNSGTTPIQWVHAVYNSRDVSAPRVPGQGLHSPAKDTLLPCHTIFRLLSKLQMGYQESLERNRRPPWALARPGCSSSLPRPP